MDAAKLRPKSPQPRGVFHGRLRRASAYWRYKTTGPDIWTGGLLGFRVFVEAKYSYGRVYDENLAMIKKWIKAAGYQVVEARQEVSGWELASDKLHFSAATWSGSFLFFVKLMVKLPKSDFGRFDFMFQDPMFFMPSGQRMATCLNLLG